MIKKWTLEKLQEEANKYKTRYEFEKNCSSGYTMSIRKKLLDELFKNHHNNGYATKKHQNWTMAEFQSLANKCLTRSEFWKNNPSAARLSSNKNIIDELFKNHKNSGYTDRQVIEGYWTKEQLQIEANKCESRGDFRNNNFKAYRRALKKNVLDEIFENHENNGYKNNDKYREDNYIIYVYEFKSYNKAYIGLTNNIIRRDRQHLWSKDENMRLFCKEKNISLPKYKILEEKLKSLEAQKQENYWINFYKNNNWCLLNKSKGGALGGNTIKWNKKKLQLIANKYKTRRDFQLNDSSAYACSTRLKLLNELFKNHINQGYIKIKKPE